MDEDQCWETFIRELAGLMNASPAIREQFIEDARPGEKRRRFAQFMHVLES
jgi:hypothetical protein